MEWCRSAEVTSDSTVSSGKWSVKIRRRRLENCSRSTRRVSRRGAVGDEFKPCKPGIAEAADFQDDAIARFLRDAEHAPNQGLLRAPQMQERRFALRAHFVLRALEPRQPFPVFPDFRRSNGAQSIEGAAQFDG